MAKRNQIFHRKKRKAPKAPKAPRVDWVHTDYSDLTPAERLKGLRALRKSVARNVKSLTLHEQGGIPSEAITQLFNAGYKTPYINSQDEFAILQEFMKHPQHTLTGYKESFAKVDSEISKTLIAFDDLTIEDQEDRRRMYWKAFNRAMDFYPWISQVPGESTNIINDTKDYLIEKAMEINDLDAMTDYMMEYFRKLSESQTGHSSDYYGTSWKYGAKSYTTYTGDVTTNTITIGDRRGHYSREEKGLKKK